MRPLELLAPARNLECGIAAIDHGADAVYIGAPQFGARAAAGNSIDDIRQLCQYAHQFRAKVYVTVNTIIYDDELPAVHRLIADLADAQVDAILVQDMALLSEEFKVKSEEFAAAIPSANGTPEGNSSLFTLHSSLPKDSSLFTLHSSLKLHASTQTDNRTPEKVAWLRSLGFSRVVLARELTLSEIQAIHEAVPDVELEVFVHGALCVSYSGLCYASQHCFGRSANRGECAQFCRMEFDLVDADGQVVVHNRHLLSLKDMNQSDRLLQLAEAGATSFKIEGRLKDIIYVKNVTAAYSQRLNDIVRRYPDRYCRASLGRCTYTFTPQLSRTFNRGYTHYFLDGRQPDIASFDTPKAMGEPVGTVKAIRRDSLTVAGLASFANGDGLCFLDANRQLQGFRVNRVEGNRLYPQHMPTGLVPGLPLYRNNDQQFERLLSRPSAVRKIPITLTLRPTPTGFSLTSGDTTVLMTTEHQLADKPQRDNIVRQLTKLGNTPYECTEVDIPADFPYFIPSSHLADLRRQLIEKLTDAALHAAAPQPNVVPSAKPSVAAYPQPHLYNIANHESASFYAVEAPTAYELTPQPGALLMQCRHCLRYSLGHCVKHGGKQPTWREPLFLRLGDGRRFRLEFDCRQCQMNVFGNVDNERMRK